jgi:MFS family permease
MTYFRKRRAFAGGLAIAGSSLGSVIFPIMVTHLIPGVGFPWTMRICAFLILSLLVIANVTISSFLVHVPRPFSILQYLRPMKEVNFLIMSISSIFLYCMRRVPIISYIRSVSKLIISSKGEILYHLTTSSSQPFSTACPRLWLLI